MMKIRLTTARAALLTGLLLGGAVETRAQEVGKFAVVQNQVTSLKPGASDSVAALPGAGIVLNEKETTGPDSAAKLTFGEGAVILASVGENCVIAAGAVLFRPAPDNSTFVGNPARRVDLTRATGQADSGDNDVEKSTESPLSGN